MTGERDWLTWVGLGVVGAAAAVMSFAALSDLARLCGITAVIGPEPGVPVAWLLPVTVDVLAAVATRVWLQRRVSVEAEHFARGAAWAAIGATVLGNAAHGVLQGAGGPPGWWAAMLVSAVPAAALGALVHLAVLVGRGAGEPGDGETSAVVADPFAALYRHLAAAEWERLAADQGEAGEGRAETPPGADASDDVLAADLRAERARTGREWVRDEVKARYRIGSVRAGRVLELAGGAQRVNGAAR